MKVLIDTHIFLWILSCPEKLDAKRRYEIETRANEIFLSSLSIAELMIKHSIGKINIHFDPLIMAEKTGIKVINFSGADAMFLGRLPLHHRDPFDRMIIAQSLVNGMPVMTDDSKFLKYECRVI